VPLLDSPDPVKIEIAEARLRLVESLRLTERLSAFAAQKPSSSGPSVESNGRFNRWTRRYFQSKPSLFTAYIESLGAPLDEVRDALTARPEIEIEAYPWISDWYAAREQEASLEIRELLPQNYGAEILCRSLIALARFRILTALEGQKFSQDKLFIGSVANLIASRVVPLLLPALVLEANLSRVGKITSSNDAGSRIRQFIDGFKDEEARERFWVKYPVLWRLAANISRFSTDATLEAIFRIMRDRAVIAEKHGIPVDQNLSSIQWGLGDSHRNGRTVAILTFGSKRLMYKPRSLAPEAIFNRFLSAYGEVVPDCPRCLAVTDLNTYGYMEFVEHKVAQTDRQIQEFYKKNGQLICISWVLGITDLHHENLIAHGGDPFLVDVECMFDRPVKETKTNPDYNTLHLQAFNSFLFGTGLLPLRTVGTNGVYDLSAIGSSANQPAPKDHLALEGVGDEAKFVLKKGELPTMQNAPYGIGQTTNPQKYLLDIISGYKIASAFFQRNTDVITENVSKEAGGKAVFRWVGRQTQDYSQLLQDAAHPSVAFEATECDMLFGGKLRSVLRYRPQIEPIILAEMDNLWNGDTPYFSTESDSGDLVDGNGNRFKEFFACDGLTEVVNRLSQLQGLCIAHVAAITAAVSSTVPLSATPYYRPVSPISDTDDPVDAGNLIQLAGDIGKSLLATLCSSGGFPFGVGLMPLEEEEYSAVILPPDLYDGLPGIGMFFGYLAKQTDEKKFHDFAVTSRKLVRNLIRNKAGAEASGAFNGLAGLIYSDLHLSACMDEAPSPVSFRAFARLQRLVEQDVHCDVISGAAGCLLVALWTLHGRQLAVFWKLRRRAKLEQPGIHSKLIRID
jgi:type 2 lantibiotic biosynthesis protein LanM